MKYLALIILSAIIGVGILSAGTSVRSATTGSGVNINATIESTTTTGCLGDSCGGGHTPVFTIVDLTATAACDEATISWYGALDGTASTTTGTLTYWPQADPGSSIIVQIPLTTNHVDTITSLLTQTTYEYRLTARAGSQSASAAPAQFTTNCVVPAPTMSVAATGRTIAATITYPDYSDIAGVIIYRGAVSSCPSSNPVVIDSRTAKQASASETFVIENPGTVGTDYGYSACIYTSGGLYSSAVYDNASRLVPDVLSATANSINTAATIGWTNPATDADHDFQRSATRVIRVSTDCAAAGISDGTLIGEITGNQATDSGLQSGQNYQYKLFTKNSYGEYSSGVCVGVTVPIAPAQCIALSSAQGSEGQIEVTWRNPTSNAEFTFQSVEWRRDTRCLTGTTGGSVVYSGVAEYYLDASPLDGLNYYTSLVRYNDGQVTNCGCVMATPTVIEEPEELCPDCQPTNVLIDSNYFTHNETFKLPVIASAFTLPVAYQLSIVVDQSLIPKPVRAIAARFNGQTYLLSYDAGTGSYRSTTMTPPTSNRYPVEISFIFEDDTIGTGSWQLDAVPWGRVTDSSGTLLNAQVILYDSDGQLVTQSGMSNPVQTSDGRYVFVVPNGNYTLEVSSPGYITQREKIYVANTVVNASIILQSEAVILPAVAAAVSAVVNAPVVQQTTLPLASVSLGVTALSTALAVPWWNFLVWFQSLFTEPLFWLSRRRRKGWGIVYNSITKQPIDLAMVRLLDATTKRLLKSKITDRDGRYTFLVDGGTYYLEVAKPGFQFPSKLLKGATEDQQYHDLYYGGPVTITEGNRGAIVFNIPLDPNGQELTNAQIFARYRHQRWHRALAYLGPLVAIGMFAINPNWITGSLVIAHAIIFVIFYRLGRTLGSKSWGVVYDRVSHKPLANAVTRIFSPEYNRMLEAYVTDRYGRYGFIAGGNQYYVTADKDGYATSRTGIVTIKPKTQAPLVSYDIGLSKGQGGPALAPTPTPASDSNNEPAPVAPVMPVALMSSEQPANEPAPVVGAVREPPESSGISNAVSQTTSEPLPVQGISVSDLAPAEPPSAAESSNPAAAPTVQAPTAPADQSPVVPTTPTEPNATHSPELPKEDEFG